jgi:UDP-N-acetylmuramate dehydrogenase
MKQVITDVTVYFPGEGVRVLSCEEMDFGYRHSLLSDRPEAVVVSAVMRLQAGEEAVIRGKMQELMGRRKTSQPLEYPSAGSTFKRPVGHFAGTLIDQCGLKGLTVGGAQVSTKHAGFVINIGGATCADVTELIRQVQARVMEEKGVWLEPEVRVVER